jgi:hypothetical protein
MAGLGQDDRSPLCWLAKGFWSVSGRIVIQLTVSQARRFTQTLSYVRQIWKTADRAMIACEPQ